VTATLLIARRELGAYFRTMSGYIMAALLLLFDGVILNAYAMGGGEMLSADVVARFFEVSFGTTAVASVFISMRLIAEERQTGTLVLLTSSPIHDWQVVVGKFLSALAFLAIVKLVGIYMPALIMVNGKVSVGHLFAGYVGVLLVGSATLAIGVFDFFMALALYARHFPPFQMGVINVRDVAYYLALTYVALFAAVRVMEARRWR
jgi:ABC-2 type transport system permease protein